MPDPRKYLRLAALAALVPALPVLPGNAPAASAELTPAQFRETAAAALRQGNPQDAYKFSAALLQRDPKDRTALLIQSRAARSLGSFRNARRAAKQAWRLAENDAQKFAASLLMAQALSSDGKKTLAQFWLRRAVHHAPNETLQRRAIRDFRYVRASSPWLHRISLSVTPESNINNGSSERTSYLHYRLTEALLGRPAEFQLGGTQMALSGIEYAVSFSTRYRFRETATRAHDLTLSADLRTYTLSGDARAQAPGAKGSDFAFGSYTAGYAHKGLNLDRRGEYRVAVHGGQTWFGGEEYTRFLRLSAGQSYKLEGGRRISARVSGDRQFGVMTSDQDTLRGDVSYSFRLGSQAAILAGLSLAKSDSPSPEDEFSEAGLRAQLTIGKPILGAIARIGVAAYNRDYAVSAHSPDGRHDEKYSADLSLTFKELGYYGFNPTLRVSGAKTDSNIGLYQSHRFGVNIGIQSAF
ncbi:surface lipoprotein assembly modifier [Cribrihabitans pelagius]|uniref:surface lipoprotein assembly modifier n=1 Tax=Cribrihabitans pelagius TaxID=1765746 RepID=UPI003B5BA922